jgi:mannose-6-phosphate isomerase-like protein (cupin superfamily)
MQYRDLIPGRLGGRFIASHIRIHEGGEVGDYVHYHKIRFQIIYCISGWARLVYQNQGPPFVMNAGDCVLQPPEIRHRVLECSPGFEVLEIGCPAVHDTFADHDLLLPNDAEDKEKLYSGQRFVHHIAQSGGWAPSRIKGVEERDTGISTATEGLADVRTVRSTVETDFQVKYTGEFLLFFILTGSLALRGPENSTHRLNAGDCFVLPPGREYRVNAGKGLAVVRVMLPADQRPFGSCN